MGFPDDASFVAGFDGDVVRSALRNTMQLAAPVKFRWKSDRQFEKASPAGNPYNWTADPVETVDHEDVEIPVAMEVTGGQQNDSYNEIGAFNPRSVTLYVLDVDYVSVDGANQVVIDDQVYDIKFHAPHLELVDVKLEVLHCQAEDLG